MGTFPDTSTCERTFSTMLHGKPGEAASQEFSLFGDMISINLPQ